MEVIKGFKSKLCKLDQTGGIFLALRLKKKAQITKLDA